MHSQLSRGELYRIGQILLRQRENLSHPLGPLCLTSVLQGRCNSVQIIFIHNCDLIKYGIFFQQDSTEDFKFFSIYSLLAVQYLDVCFNEL